MVTCSACKSARMEEAVVMGAGLVPARASNFQKAMAAAVLTANVCMDCGNVDGLRADVVRLAKMLPE